MCIISYKQYYKQRFTSRRNNNHNNGYSGLKEATFEAEKEVIANALKEANFNKSKAAKMLKIDRKTLYNKIKQYNIDVINQN